MCQKRSFLTQTNWCPFRASIRELPRRGLFGGLIYTGVLNLLEGNLLDTRVDACSHEFITSPLYASPTGSLDLRLLLTSEPEKRCRDNQRD